jgi:hypothetical protein
MKNIYNEFLNWIEKDTIIDNRFFKLTIGNGIVFSLILLLIAILTKRLVV